MGFTLLRERRDTVNGWRVALKRRGLGADWVLMAHESSVRSVVLLAHGPSSVTTGAGRRARRMVGDAGSVVVIVMHPRATGPAAVLAAEGAIVVDELDPSPLETALSAAGSDSILIVHDDVSWDADGPGEQWVQRSRPIAFAGVEGELGIAIVGTPTSLAEAVRWNGRSMEIDDAAVDIVGSRLVHQRRCQTAPARERALLAAALIVRDEAEHLAACLGSLAGVVDDVVVCDTGSQDSTPRIAASNGARVIERSWRDDFGWARNEVVAECDARWVLWIDADERLVCPEPAVLRTLLGETGPDIDSFAVQIESRRSGGPTTRSLAQRIFRPDRLRFEGAIHEELVRRDGSAPHIAPLSELRIEHLGYEADVVAARAKTDRNLRIARRQHDRTPTPKATLDLARSMAFAGADAAQILDVTDSALTERVDGPIGAALWGLRAGILLELRRFAEAVSAALETLSRSPGDDHAAAVLAAACTETGDDELLVETLGDGQHDWSPLRTPLNRVSADAMTAAAAIRLGRHDLARLAAHRAAGVDDVPVRQRAVLLAEAMGDGPAAAEVVASLPEPVRVAIGSRQDPPKRFEPQVTASDEPASGITFDLDFDRLPIASSEIVDIVPPRRRVLEWTGDEHLAVALGSISSTVQSVTPDSDIVDAMARLDGRFDVVIGGLSAHRGIEVMEQVRWLLDPSGSALVWEVDASGCALAIGSWLGLEPGAAGSATGAFFDAVLDLGFTRDPTSPRGVTRLRPTLDGTSIERGPAGSTDGGAIEIRSPEMLSSEMQLAYRLAFPDDIDVRFAADRDPADASVPVLVTEPGIIPAPGWVQRLWDSVRATNRAAGVRVIDTEGLVVHAGLDDRGRPVGRGEPVDGPVTSSDRTDARLERPFMLPAGVGRSEVPRGRLLATAPAVTVTPDDGSLVGPTLREVVPRSVLFLGGEAPGRGGSSLPGGIESVMARLVDVGVTPIYQWSSESEEPDPYLVGRWRESGVIVFGPPTSRQPLEPDPIRPRADALVQAFGPGSIVYLGNESLRHDFPMIAGRGSSAQVVFCASSLDENLADRPDVVVPLDRIVQTVMGPRTRIPAAAAVPHIEPVQTRPGVTSIIIPVHNRWDLTRACIESIRRHTVLPVEIIVVDNGSTDGTATALASVGDVRVIENAENRGFPRAVNQGIAVATGQYVCVLNNDTEVTPGWLEELLNALNVPRTGMVGPRSNEIAGLQRVPDAPSMATPDRARDWAASWARTRSGQSWPATRLVGFCMLARRATFEDVGGFDEGFGIGNSEDDEMGHRLARAGYGMRVADGSVILHHGSATFRDLGLDYAALLHGGARHAAGRTTSGGLTVAIVLSDGNPAGAAAAAASALRVVDSVRVAERWAPLSTGLAVAGVRAGEVEVVSTDWATDAGARATMEGVSHPIAFVIGSSERLDGGDWGAARSELEGFVGRAVEVATASGAEVRIVPPGPEALDLVGTGGDRRAESFRLA